MKKSLAALAALILALSVSCASNTPEAVAKAFLIKMNDLDFNGAALLSTPEGVENVRMLESLMNMAPKEELDRQREAAEAKPVKILSAQLNGDSAVVQYQLGESPQEKLNMKKVDGSWKVDFTKGVEG